MLGDLSEKTLRTTRSEKYKDDNWPNGCEAIETCIATPGSQCQGLIELFPRRIKKPLQFRRCVKQRENEP